MSARVQVFPVRNKKGQPTGEWAFRVRARNSQKWATSESYTREQTAKRAASRFLVSIAHIAAHERARVAEPDVYAPVIEVVDR